MIEANQQSGLYFLMNGKGNTELTSLLNPGQQRYPAMMSGVAQQQGNTPFSAELVLLTRQTFAENQTDLIIRGVTPAAFAMTNPRNGQHYISIIRGKMFTAGRREILIGAELLRRYPQLQPGHALKIHGAQWQITGVFTSGGSVRESEILADRDMLRNDFGLGNIVNVVVFYGTADATLTQLNDELQGIEQGTLSISDSRAHYASHGQDLLKLSGIFAGAFAATGGIMVLSGVAVLIESLLVNVSTDIRALRLMGFGRPLFLAFSVPIMLCSLAGTIIGVVLYRVFANKLTFSTLAGPAEMVFHASLTFTIVLSALAYCLFIALLGCVMNYRRVLMTPRA
ncbi:hypothetical protein [Candidatus Pantoea multigeneris]|uniref:Uncharacterized protein n=1 Tax=Candidatus Pantoea multigeneris TaxID=2608357 RepID=A0ABX0R891_9GAMM|nr:hypothetical protein [Pantoea multigeneris]NIF20358.1 hypothetical protein [Pantoea multigeneris]